MSAFLGLLGFGAVCCIDSLNKNAKIKKNCARLKDQGAFLEVNYERHNMIHQDYWMEWFTGEGKFVPEEYKAYFRKNPEAAKEYILAMTSQQEINEGYQPMWCIGVYNKYAYDAFRRFNSLYSNKIKIYNESGKLYY